MESFLNWYLATWLGQHVSPEVSVFLVSLLPLIEERGGLVLASMLKIPLKRALLPCVIGNILPIPFILFFIKKLLHWMSSHKMGRLAAWIENKAEKNRPKIEKDRKSVV